MKETGMDRNEMYQLLASTGNKIQYATNQSNLNLRLLVLLCNTFDHNLPILQSMACSTGYIYDSQEEVSPACEQNDSDDFDDYKDIDKWDGLEATDNDSLGNKAEDELLPPDVSKCSTALRVCLQGNLTFLLQNIRICFTEVEDDERAEVSQKRLELLELCDTGSRASRVDTWWRDLAQKPGFTRVVSAIVHLWTGGH
jgi:hypothetical protein